MAEAGVIISSDSENDSDTTFVDSESLELVSEDDDPMDADDEMDPSVNDILRVYQEVHSIPSKNGNINWTFNPVPTGEPSSTKKYPPGPTRYACASITDIKSSFRLYINNLVMGMILSNTNTQGRRIYGDEWESLNQEMLEAYLGLLLLCGIFRCHGESLKSLWSEETGRHIFSAAMTLKMFRQITNALRFDWTESVMGKSTDDLIAIRDLWVKWSDILPSLYSADDNVTVDERIVPFKGSYPFKKYTAQKTSRYGVRIWTLCESSNSYVLRVLLDEKKENDELPDRVDTVTIASDLTFGIKFRNLICNKYFTSYQLGQALLKGRVTMLGAIKSSSLDLPFGAVSKEAHTTNFYYAKDTTLMYYTHDRNRQIILMSTKHKKGEVNTRGSRRPLMVTEYNSAKGAVARLERLLDTYSCRRKTKLWTTALFYNIIDTSAYNAYVLWTEIHPSWKRNNLYKRRIFLEELGKALVMPYTVCRTTLARAKAAMSIMKNAPEKPVVLPSCSTSESRRSKRARCNFCPSKCRKKTNYKCVSCEIYICKTHAFYLCPECKD